MATHSSVLVWESPWTEEPGVAKSRTQLNNNNSSIPPNSSTKDPHVWAQPLEQDLFIHEGTSPRTETHVN